MSMLKRLVAVASPAGERSRLSILIFHRVLPSPDPLFPAEVDAATFDRMLSWIEAGFTVLPLDEAVQRLKAGSLPQGAAAITFDDGYADNQSVALPILRRRGMSATFFIATGFMDGGRMWNDTIIESVRHCELPALDLRPMGLGLHGLSDVEARRRAIAAIIGQVKYRDAPARVALAAEIAERARAIPANDLMMSTDQIRALRAAGMQIGAHTVSHPILARTDAASACDEVQRSRQDLQSLLGERIGLFAYPNGRAGTDYLPEHAAMVEALGFDAAVTTDWGAADRGTNHFRLPRFTPWDRRRWQFSLRLLLNSRGQQGPRSAN